MPKSSSLGLSLTKDPSSPAMSTIDQVSSLSFCMAGDLVDGGCKGVALSLLAKGASDSGVGSFVVSGCCPAKS